MGFFRTTGLMLFSAVVGGVFVQRYSTCDAPLPVSSRQLRAESPGQGQTPFAPTRKTSQARRGGSPGQLLIPVAGVRAVQLVSNFAEARDGGNRRHEGLDIMAPWGTPVVAAGDGKVAKLFTSEKGGLTVYIKSPDGFTMYYYAHLSRYDERLREGNAVRRGDFIAFVGSTGNADQKAPHLHFGIFDTSPEANWSEGTAVDPYPLLKRNVE